MDIERAMQFIIDHQAQFSTDIARINLILLGSAERQSKSEETMVELRQTLLDVANAQERTNEILATLAQRQITTEENLNALIVTVERHVADDN